MFHSCATAPNNARSKEAQAPAKAEGRGLWWKESSPWEDWLVTWQAFRISTKIISNRSSIIFTFFPTCSFFNWNMIPGSLLPLFNICQILAPKNKADTPSLSYQNDITLCSVSEQLVYECRWHEILPRSSIQRCMLINFPLDLCYANQDLH